VNVFYLINIDHLDDLVSFVREIKIIINSNFLYIIFDEDNVHLFEIALSCFEDASFIRWRVGSGIILLASICGCLSIWGILAGFLVGRDEDRAFLGRIRFGLPRILDLPTEQHIFSNMLSISLQY
jgi:hypothetical protein